METVHKAKAEYKCIFDMTTIILQESLNWLVHPQVPHIAWMSHRSLLSGFSKNKQTKNQKQSALSVPLIYFHPGPFQWESHHLKLWHLQFGLLFSCQCHCLRTIHQSRSHYHLINFPFTLTDISPPSSRCMHSLLHLVSTHSLLYSLLLTSFPLLSVRTSTSP